VARNPSQQEKAEMSKFRFRGKAERDLVRWARDHGWEVVGRNGNNHITLRHRAVGIETQIPSKIVGYHLSRAAYAQLTRLVPSSNAP
jgi:hypothetical protein